MSAIHKRAQRATFSVIAVLMGLSLFAPIVALGNGDLVAGDTATISTGGGDATVRTSASSSAEPVGSIPNGTEVYIVDGPVSDTDGSLWYQAGVWDMTGYISSTVLEGTGIPAPAAEEEAAPVEETSTPLLPWKQPIDYGVVVDNNNAPLPGDGLACRADADGSADVIVRLGLGQSVEVTGPELWSEGVAFLPVNCAGQGGFVKADYVALNSEPAAEPEAAVVEEPVTTEEDIATDAVTEEPVADIPVAGDLIVRVSDQTGAPVPGLCFQLYADGAWVADACDGTDAIPNNGNSGFFGIPSGGYTLIASSVPGGQAVDNREVSIVAGDTGSLAIALNVTSEAEAEEVVVTDEPVVTEEAAAADESVVAEAAVVADEPVATVEDVATVEPVATVEEVVVIVEPVVAEEAVTALEDLATEAPVVTEDAVTALEDVATEAPVVAEDAVTALEETVVTEDVEAAVVTEEPVTAGLDLSQALGDATVTGTNGEGVRCRVAPDASSATIMVLAEGATVFVLEGPVDGYLGVPCGDQVGYADINYMLAYGAGDEIPASASSVVVVGTGGMSLNCRSGAGSSFGVLTSVPQGSVLTSRGASSNGWAPVVCNGMNGFVSIAFVETSGGGSGTGSGTGGTGGSTLGTGTISNTGGDGLRCRTAPNGSVIMVLAEGTRVTTRGAESGGWVPVACGGMNGFVSSMYITLGSGSGTTNPSPAPGDSNGGVTSGNVTVTGTGGASLNCRSAASMSGMVITAIPAGSTVAVRGAAANGWQPVTCAGRAGYVSTDFISASTGSVTPSPNPAPSNPGSGQTGTAVVTTGGGGLYCRTEPGGSAITIVADGATVMTRGASSNGWTPVVCGGMNGFMSSQYLSTGGGGSTTPAPAPDTDSGSGSAMKSGDNGKVAVRANMRYSASLSANVVVIVESGEVLRITGNASNGFYPVSYDGLNGFMATELLTKTSEALSERGGSGNEPAPQPAPGGGGSTATGNAIVNYAMRYVGYPYVWATAGPSSFDCSGFTNWVIKNVVGPDIGRGLWTQWASGVAVSRENLQPGDLVFFQNTYKAGLSHNGIYIGNNQFVHAENATTGVRVSDMNSTYYGSRWLGGRRIN